jgi:hypothetical protein
MKSEIKHEIKTIVYPHLGIYEKGQPFIVLFSSEDTGQVVWSDNTERPLGYYACDWAEWSFSPFSGSITLSNN